MRYVQTLSQTAAIEYVAATIAHKRDQVKRTVILCEDDQLAMQLDACLLRYGLPTMGASASSPAHPVLQVLPLSLALCWQPVDPQFLLDFLTLPVGPIPRRAATALANALTVEPRLGSSEWQACINDLCSAENDPEGKLRERLKEWLFCPRVNQNSRISTKVVRDRCASVSKWATGLAIVMKAEEAPQLLLIHALRVAAGQATLLGELAQSQGGELGEPQWSRLVEEALSTGVETVGAIEAAGGPIRIRSLSEIVDPCYRVIWLGLGTSDASACRWSADQLQAFRNLGIDVDDGTNSLTSLRSAEARGLCLVEDSLLAILLPQDMEKRWHPIWLAVRTIITSEALEHAPVLENLIERNLVSSLEPFTFSTESMDVERAQPVRPIWSVVPALLSDRDTVSATELEDRLACPLKWVFRHRANLRPSSIAQLPDDYRLKGSFCHKILEYAFSDGGELPPVDEAVARVERLFDERLELDAAPLAQSDKYRERQSLRRELAHATRILIATLASGGYRVKGIEVEVRGEAFGKPLSGSIDCLIQRGDGSEGIIDFKYGGKKYERMIADGKAVQLATYAYSRSVETGQFPAVAYLVLADGLLFTPSGGALDGDDSRTVVDGPGIRLVWEQFQAAIENAEEWLTTNGQIPGRPLQGADQWPAGAAIVLEAYPKPNEVQSV
ncbi:MAG TPA: PD-(D/E)XK nuclease family protein, partial [Schlesneria sp.]